MQSVNGTVSFATAVTWRRRCRPWTRPSRRPSARERPRSWRGPWASTSSASAGAASSPCWRPPPARCPGTCPARRGACGPGSSSTRSRYACRCTWHQHRLSVIVTPPPTGGRTIAMSVSVCLSVCVCDYVFACPRSYPRNCTSDLHLIFGACYLWSWLGSSSGGVVICYVLRILWMTSCLLIIQGCSTSPPSWSAAHTQLWAWL